MSQMLVGGRVTFDVTLLEGNDSKRVVRDVTSLVTDKSRVIILNLPKIFADSVLTQYGANVLGQVVVKRDMIVICDGGDSKMVYDDEKHCRMATFPSVSEQSLTVYDSQERMLLWIFESAVFSS